MQRGAKPKPTALKLIDGDRKSRINTNEPKPSVRNKLECPPGTARAVADIFRYTVRELEAMGIAYACDRDALLCFCEAVVNHRKASELLKKSSILVNGKMGGLVRNPALAVQHQSALIIRGFAAEFGLTPSARSRIETKGTDNGADDLFSGIG